MLHNNSAVIDMGECLRRIPAQAGLSVTRHWVINFGRWWGSFATPNHLSHWEACGADRKAPANARGRKPQHGGAQRRLLFRGLRGERIERVPLSLLHSQQRLRSLCAPLEKTRNKSRATPTVLLIKAIPMPVSGEIVHGIKSSFIFSPVKMLGRSIKASHVHTKAQKVLCLKKYQGEEKLSSNFLAGGTWQLIIVLVHSADCYK